MKRTQKIWPLLCLLFVAAFLLLAQTAMATLTPSFSWDAPSGDAPTGYILKYDTVSGGTDGTYAITVDTGSTATTYTLPSALNPSTDYYFVVTAYNLDGESGPSNELHVSTGDNDGDTLLNYEETHVYGTDTDLADSDEDNLDDYTEIFTYSTDPLLSDSDYDGMNDDAELVFWDTDWNGDADGDGIINLLDEDSDNDGIFDGYDDYLGLTIVRIGVFIPSTGKWYIDNNGNGAWEEGIDTYIANFGGGLPDPIPVTGDWDNDGTKDVGIFVPSTGKWYLDTNSNGIWDEGIDIYIANFGGGLPGPIPVTGDWDNDGIDEIGVFVPSTGKWYLDADGNGAWNETNDIYVANFGGGFLSPLPIAGDWDNDGDIKIGVFVPSTGKWYLDANNNHSWDSAEDIYAPIFGKGLTNPKPVILVN